jgi:hypothetical protein
MRWITHGGSVEAQNVIHAEELPDNFSFKINDLHELTGVTHAEELPRPCAEELPHPANHVTVSL